MPRMNLTEAEAKAILRSRELSDREILGWNNALSEAITRIDGMDLNDILQDDLVASLNAMKRTPS